MVLSDEQRSQLRRWSRGGSTPYRLVMRARIVLLAAEGHSNRDIARLLLTNPITVARWRSRFLLLGLPGIRTEAPRTGSPPPVSDEVVRRVISKTLTERPDNRLRWSTRSLAHEVGVSHSTVRRIWKAYGLRPNRSRVSLLAQDTRFRPKKVDVVGVYVNPPQRAIAISLSEQGSAPPPNPRRTKGAAASAPRPATGPWMKDLVTTLNLLDQPRSVRTSRRHVDQEFLSFLRSVQERRVPNDRILLLAESGGPSLSHRLSRWLSRHPQVSTEVCDGKETWKQKIVETIQEASEDRTAEAPPEGLPKLLSAVDRWKRVSDDDGQRPFAWTQE